MSWLSGVKKQLWLWLNNKLDIDNGTK